MPYIVVQNFAAGLDRRGSQIGGSPGSLWDASNVRINRKGEIERRKKWVSTYSLPSAGNTFGMHATTDDLYVFGSVAASAITVPSAVTYQRLQHPDGATAMSDVLYTENFDGAPYVVAEFADGDVYHFYDGALVDDWYAGIARDDMTNNSGIASHMQGLIDAHADYIATVSAAVVTVTGASNVAFDIETSTANGSAVNNQSISVASTQTAVADVAEVRATGTLTVVAGTAATAAVGSVDVSAGSSGSVDTLTVNGVAIISAAVAFSTSLAVTASALASAITAYSSTPDYTASAVATLVTITAPVSAGATANGYVVSAGTTDLTVATVNMSAGVDSGISALTVDGVNTISAQVNYTSSNSLLAAAIASAVNAYSSSPEYSATVSGAVVTLRAAAGTGNGPNGFTVSAAGQSTATFSTTNMTGGVASVTGQPQINTFTIGGTFEAGDKFSITLGDDQFGFLGNPTARGRTALTFKSKLYSTVSSLLLFSGIDDATVWNNDNVDVVGANFINLSSKDGGSEVLYGMGVYQGNLAIFARRVVQVWSVSDDETANTFLQAVKNTGSRTPKSILSFGNNDVFYRADSGIRSLRARDSSNAAYVSDVGTSIDSFLKEYSDTLSAARIEEGVAVLEPDTDRYMYAEGLRVWVFNYFPGAKISAWTYDDVTDDVGVPITDFARIGSTLYARAGNTIYTYGGAAGSTYPSAGEVVATVVLPFLDGSTPGTPKELEGFDAAVTGTWTTTILVDPSDTNVFVSVGVLTAPTYPDDRIPVTHKSTHFAPKFVCSAAGAATITDLVLHYKRIKGEEG